MGSDTPAQYVIIGAGLAGYGVVREMRRSAPEASIVVVTRDEGHFYSKPAISTALAKGKHAAGLVTMPAERMIATQRVALRPRTDVTAIDRDAQTVHFGDETLRYDRLILATGATAIRPTLGGDAAGDALSVNTLDDYTLFRERLAAGMRVAVIGAGLVGSEFANDLSQHGHPVTVIDPLPTPLGQLVPQAVGETLRDALSAQGVAWRFGTSVSAIDHVPGGYRLTLADGGHVEADLVLSAIGLRPAVALAEAAGLATARGILVDDHGRTSDANIFAIGDCAEYPHGVSAFVTPIMAAARAIAATATGTPTAMAFPALSVQVKTTACPLVLLSPGGGAEGRWMLAERTAGGQKHLFMTSSGAVAGYAMTGSFCEQRVDLDRAIAAGEGLRDVA